MGKIKTPCADCITLAICRPIGIQTNGISHLAIQCSIIRKWLAGGNEHMYEWDMDLFYKAYHYFDRCKHE